MAVSETRVNNLATRTERGPVSDILHAERSQIESLLYPNYRIGKLLAHTTMSRVYAAQRRVDGLPVIIKIVASAAIHHARTFQAVSERVSLSSRIDHPNLVRVLETGTHFEEKLVYLVLERVDGPTLREYFLQAESTLTIGAVVELLRQVATAIDSLHRDGIIHRDVKPDNILITAHGTAKLGDYGLALDIREVDEKPTADTSGTPAYMAPEQVIGTCFGPQVDIYSFAMSIYTLLTRSLAFDVTTTRDLVFAQINKPPVLMRRRNRSWPHELERAVHRSLSKNWDERHPTALALANEVAETLRPFTPFRLASYFDGSLSRCNSGEILLDF